MHQASVHVSHRISAFKLWLHAFFNLACRLPIVSEHAIIYAIKNSSNESLPLEIKALWHKEEHFCNLEYLKIQRVA